MLAFCPIFFFNLKISALFCEFNTFRLIPVNKIIAEDWLLVADLTAVHVLFKAHLTLSPVPV